MEKTWSASTIMDHFPVNVHMDTPLLKTTALVMLTAYAVDFQCLQFFSLTDVNECEVGEDNCHTFASCNDTDGSYYCLCNEGFSGDGVTCTGIYDTIAIINHYVCLSLILKCIKVWWISIYVYRTCSSVVQILMSVWNQMAHSVMTWHSASTLKETTLASVWMATWEMVSTAVMVREMKSHFPSHA